MTPWKRGLAALGLLAFVAVGVAGAVLASSFSRRLVFGLCAMFFAAMFLIALPNLFRRGNVPLLTVAAEGIDTRLAGVIPWDEIERVDYTSVAGQPAIGIWTKDPFFNARRGPWWLWPFAIFNRLFGYPSLSFTKGAVPIDELYAEINRRWQSTSTASDADVVFEISESN